MSNKQVTIGVRIDEQVLNRLDNWIAAQPVPPARSRAIAYAIKEFVDAQESNANADAE